MLVTAGTHQFPAVFVAIFILFFVARSWDVSGRVSSDQNRYFDVFLTLTRWGFFA